MLYPISVPIPNSSDDLIGYINAQGRVVVPPSYAGGSYFFEGKASVIAANGTSGFIDNSGNLAVPFRFSGLGIFKDGLCSINGGYIDHEGNWFIEPRYLVTGEFSEGRAFVSTDGERFGVIDYSGETSFSRNLNGAATSATVWRPSCVRVDGATLTTSEVTEFRVSLKDRERVLFGMELLPSKLMAVGD
jgi:hypothetical protein